MNTKLVASLAALATLAAVPAFAQTPAPAAPAAAAAPMASGAMSVDKTTIGALWANPTSKAVLEKDVPGIDQKDIDIQLENGTLTIKGERKFEREQGGRGLHRIERAYGAFARSFALPETVDTEKVKADYKDGVLTITVAKKEVAKPRSIKVEVSK